jgi:NADH-quinone oxidoreductase subunit J
VFAILLTRGSETPVDSVYSRSWIWGFAVAAAVFSVLGTAVLGSAHTLPHETAKPVVTVLDIGNALMSRYVLVLEIIALLLTIATIGAVIVAMAEKERAQ